MSRDWPLESILRLAQIKLQLQYTFLSRNGLSVVDNKNPAVFACPPLSVKNRVILEPDRDRK